VKNFVKTPGGGYLDLKPTLVPLTLSICCL